MRVSRKEKMDCVNKRLKPITQKQKDYFIKRISHPFCTWKKVSSCWNCGTHFAQNGKVNEHTECPVCHASGIVKRARMISDDIWYCTTEKIDKYQVIRMYYVSVDYYQFQDFEGKTSSFDFRECYRNFVDEKGNRLDYARGMRPLSGYVKDPFNWNTPLHLYKYSGSGYCGDVCDQYPFISYPWGSVQEWLRKRGFSGNFNHYESISPLMLLRELVSNPITETIVKRKEYRWFDISRSLQKEMWSQMKICFRNGYYPKDISMWYDTLKMQKDLCVDIHNPKFVCPVNLKEAHDNAVIKTERKREKERKERLRKEMLSERNREENYQKFLEPYRNICIIGGGFEIRPIPTSDDFFMIGDKMRQCLATAKYYKKFTSLVMSAWMDGRIVENLEVNLSDLKIIQCRGQNNSHTEFHEQIVSLVNSRIRGEFIKNNIKPLTA